MSDHEHGDGGETEYGLELPFDIDDGSLDGLTPQQAFTLGVEWGNLWCDLQHDARLVQATVHTANAERIMRLCRRMGREPQAEDLGDGWTLFRFMTTAEALDLLEGGE